jgi:cholesterol transport system auxiliary component
MPKWPKPKWLAGSLAVLLTGCVSLGGAEPPDSLITLSASSSAPAGQDSGGTVAEALAVIEPAAPLKLDVMRVPVQVDDSTVAYLKDATWVEKPARLFGRVLAETIRAKGARFVVDGSEIRYAAATRLTGNLTEMGYDARSGSVVVRYDAMLQQDDGTIRTRRFEAVETGVVAEVWDVAPALNRASNRVAAEVADWVG